MFKWIKGLFRHHGCSMYDELHHCCALERMEKVYQPKYHDNRPAWMAACFDEMD